MLRLQTVVIRVHGERVGVAMSGQHRRYGSSPVVRRAVMLVVVPLSLLLAAMVGLVLGTLLGVYAPGSLPLPN
ncbi:hypothetical protein GCM10010198_02090 [Nocardia seriolae]|nr:hypothetical protein NS2_61440 [Nocardia seriolae NBRC 15557]